ncbi:hypothetical protein YC2023_058789 [Brassica napus]
MISNSVFRFVPFVSSFLFISDLPSFSAPTAASPPLFSHMLPDTSVTPPCSSAPWPPSSSAP